jgi:rhamnogalacturonyl hydrolase YesR
VAGIWVNDQLIFYGSEKKDYRFREYTYDRFYFDQEIILPLKMGKNKILVRAGTGDGQWLFILRPVNELGDEEHSVKFSTEPYAPSVKDQKWLITGPFFSDNFGTGIFPPEKSIEDKYFYKDEWYSWQVPSRDLILELKLNPNHTFSRESYADWHYGIGATLLSILNLDEETGKGRYKEFVEQYADFVIDNLDYFTWQYYEYHAIRESFHRLIRRTMLDDCGAPSFPLLELIIREKSEKYRFLIDTLANFIANNQSRLEDGTLCRPEPLRWTIWADDLFMSVPFMIRMGKITGDSSWYADAVHQVLQFNKYLYDAMKGLYKHGWFSQSGETSEVFWCRANGWMAWAMAEVLLWLPVDYPGYDSMLNIFKMHIESLAKYQDKTGLWHQVLDHPDSYLETSGSAMYVLAMARGVNKGWLDKKFADTAIRGWEGISERITPDGIVSGICRGTPIGNSVQFYNNRETYDNDPRGLGAVIQAGIEMHKLLGN